MLTVNHSIPAKTETVGTEGDEGRDMFVIFAVLSTGWFPPG